MTADLVHQDALDLFRIWRGIERKLSSKYWRSPFAALIDVALLAQRFEFVLVEGPYGTVFRKRLEHPRVWGVDAVELDRGVSRVLSVQ